ncbi:MAG: MarR family winged helix-turn-helix transcriptional regulator [Chloroflexota bacterium]
MSEVGGDALGTSILFDVFALNQAVARLLNAAMRGGPLTPGEYAIYSAVFELEAASPTELAARLGMRLTTFMDQLRLLEGRGHAHRVENPRDRRSYRVLLTNAGLEAHRAANRRFEEAFQAFIAQLPDGEAAAKQGLLVVREAAEGALGRFSEVASPRPKVGRAG